MIRIELQKNLYLELVRIGTSRESQQMTTCLRLQSTIGIVKLRIIKSVVNAILKNLHQCIVTESLLDISHSSSGLKPRTSDVDGSSLTEKLVLPATTALLEICRMSLCMNKNTHQWKFLQSLTMVLMK